MKTALFYTCNAGYLVPGLVSALAARRLTSRDLADVILFDIGPETREGDAIGKAAEANGVQYRWIDADFLEGMHIVYARLMVERFLPSVYEDFVYIDSDTQVWRSLDELAAAPVAGGKVLACRDPMAMMAASGHPSGQAAPAAGQPHRGESYINAGVFKAERKVWERISAEALALTRSGAKFDFRDQDVINIVARDAIEIMSLKWNFPAFYLRTGLDRVVAPHLVHFMANPRPWHGSFFPWGPAGRQPYQQLANSYPELAAYWPKLKPLRYAKYIAQQQYKRLMEAPIYSNARFMESVRRSESGLAVQGGQALPGVMASSATSGR